MGSNSAEDIVINGVTCRKVDGLWYEEANEHLWRAMPLEAMLLDEIERLRAERDAIDALPDTVTVHALPKSYPAQMAALQYERGYAEAMRQVKALLQPEEARRER